MVSIKDSKFDHADLHLLRIKKDERDVQSIKDLLTENWIDPHQPEPNEFVSLSTALAAQLQCGMIYCMLQRPLNAGKQ